MNTGKQVILKLGHSPDPDDAFMWWPITQNASGHTPLEFPNLRFEPVHLDIESLNQQAQDPGDLEITGISCATYPYVQDRYAILSCGHSFGLQYGPKLVSSTPCSLEDLQKSDAPIAIPGHRTTAAMVAAMAVDCDVSRLHPVPFDEIIDRINAGDFQAGVVIHEGQLTFSETSLNLVTDLGAWWDTQHGLPLPLGLNVIHRDLDERFGEGTLSLVVDALSQSIDYSLEHRADAIAYAKQFGRGISHEIADKFVEMYVNPLTVDCGDQGLVAIEKLLAEGFQRGLSPEVGSLELVRGSDRIVESEFGV